MHCGGEKLIQHSSQMDSPSGRVQMAFSSVRTRPDAASIPCANSVAEYFKVCSTPAAVLPPSPLEQTSYFSQTPRGHGEKLVRTYGFYFGRLDGTFLHPCPADTPESKHSVDSGRRVGRTRVKSYQSLLLSALDTRSVCCLYVGRNISLGRFPYSSEPP